MSYLLKKGGLCRGGGAFVRGGGFCLFPNCHTLSLHRQDRDNILCKQPPKIDYRKGGGGGSLGAGMLSGHSLTFPEHFN